MIRHWRAARGEGGGWLYSPAAPAFFISGGYCCRPRPTDVVITTGNGAVTPYLRTTQTWNGTAWTTRTDIPLPGRFSAAGTYLNGLLHVTGGLGPAPLDTHHQWNPPTDSWSTQLPVPLPRRSDHSAVTLNNALHLWGGRSSPTSPLGATHEYRTGTWVTGRPLPGPPRSNARALTLNGRGYIFAGETTIGAYTTRVDCYDPNTQTWTAKQPLPPPGRQGCGGFTYQDACVILGGGRPTTSYAGAYLPVGDVWRSLTPVPTPTRQYSEGSSKASTAMSAAIGGEDEVGTRLRRHDGFGNDTWFTLEELPSIPRRLLVGA